MRPAPARRPVTARWWLAAAAISAACAPHLRAAPGPTPPAAAPVDLDELRRATSACPVPLTDAALDDLATYQACRLPPALSRLVRNDYADDAPELPDLGALRRHAGQVPRSLFEAQLRQIVDPRGVLAGTLAVEAARGVLRPDPVLAPELEIPFAPEPPLAGAPPGCAPRGGDGCAGRLVPSPHPERPFRAARRAELLRRADPARPLAGLRLTLDPGHGGGPYALLEERRMEYQPPGGGPPLLVQEGDLALRTALELRARLAARGADVRLTRDRPSLVHADPLHAFRPAAERLLRRIALDPEYAAVERALPSGERLRLRAAVAVFAVRKQSRFESLRARARAASGADLVLSIHYNAFQGGPAPAAAGRPEVVAMVRGFHGAERAYNPHHRWRALEAAFAIDDVDASAHLGALCVATLSQHLGMPVARDPRYRDHLPLRDGAGRPAGVDAWDGALLRELDGVAVLTEGPYLDDPEELPRLRAALDAPPGTAGTRTAQYAGALAECVEAFTRRWLASERNPFSDELPPAPGGAADPVDTPRPSAK